MIEREKITAFCDRVVEQFQPEKVILFGSYAYGSPTPDSDVDVLVVLPFKGKNPEKATEIWMASRPRFPIDIMVRKPQELQRRLELGDVFLQEIIERGTVLYEAAYA
ncbi:MAG: nucleotidyltransferase domain-containing protein [Chloroflexi bacterium]|nr:nucleotidyltransferase domain-containing protein [Chloroflexota bacterium]MBU1662079.1 nucleotidyltransferase domain-containing protein [Chloroflexota bacterium]